MQHVFVQALSITGFVFVMMLVIEYLNFLTSGVWQEKLAGNRWGQYSIAALLGVIPGCLGAFMVVGMYSHRLLSLGAVVTAMIATSGDEAFVMLAMMPRQAVVLSLVLLVVGVIAGVLTDAFARGQDEVCTGLQVHEDLQCRCFSHGQIQHQLRRMSPVRGVLVISLVVFIFAVASGQVGPDQWNWIRITFLSLSAIALLIVTTSPEHFLEQHLWHHVAIQHLPRIFAWTLGALLLMHLLTEYLHLEGLIHENPWSVLVIACLVGVIPESGPQFGFLDAVCRGRRPPEHIAGQFDCSGRSWHVALVGAFADGLCAGQGRQPGFRPGRGHRRIAPGALMPRTLAAGWSVCERTGEVSEMTGRGPVPSLRRGRIHRINTIPSRS